MRKKIGLMILIVCISILTASIAYGADLVISTADELRAFATEVNNGNRYSGKTVELANDIDLKSIEFTPIGSFAGTFDGKGYEIKNLYISDETLSFDGLFGYITSGTIKNLTVSGNITGDGSDKYIGGIIGYANGEVIIENCISNVMITSDASYYIGGIVGSMGWKSKIINCENRGNIIVTSSGNAFVGGIVGFTPFGNYKGYIKECHNSGKITNLSGKYTGGIAGCFGCDGGEDLINCYNTGEIIGNTNVGGIAGINDGGDIINVYNTGKVTGTDASSTGGIVGTSNNKVTYAYNSGVVNDGAGYGICASNSGTITDVYYLLGTASVGVGGTEVAIVKTSAELKSDEMVELLMGSQTDALWVKDINNINSGYPVFSYQKVPVIDTIAPTGTISLGSTYYEANGYKYVKSNEVTINLTASDDISEQSNIKVALINEKDYSRTNSNSSINWLSFSPSIQWTASSGKGLKRVYVIFKDEAGNQSLYLAT